MSTDTVCSNSIMTITTSPSVTVSQPLQQQLITSVISPSVRSSFTTGGGGAPPIVHIMDQEKIAISRITPTPKVTRPYFHEQLLVIFCTLLYKHPNVIKSVLN